MEAGQSLVNPEGQWQLWDRGRTEGSSDFHFMPGINSYIACEEELPQIMCL
jgi:hypothetical protein